MLGQLIHVFYGRLPGISDANMEPSRLGVPEHTETFKKLITLIEKRILPTYVTGTSLTWGWAITQTFSAIGALRDEIETQIKYIKKQRRGSLPLGDHMFLEDRTIRTSPPKWIEIDHRLMGRAVKEAVRFADMIKDLIRRRNGESPVNVWQKVGDDFWQIRFQSPGGTYEKAIIKDGVGLPFIAKLLERPDRQFTIARMPTGGSSAEPWSPTNWLACSPRR